MLKMNGKKTSTVVIGRADALGRVGSKSNKIVLSLSLMLATDKKYNHLDAKRKKRDQASSEKHDLFLVLLAA